LTNTALAVVLALVSALGFGAAFVFTQFALKTMPPWLGAAFSVPTSTLLFWCLGAFLVDPAKADMGAAALFAGVGLFFPATVTLLNFESNRLMGANVAGAMSGLAPIFAVLLALVLLGETLSGPQLLGIGAVIGGVTLLYGGKRKSFAISSAWMLLLPLAAAALRGAVQPIVKVGLDRWPSPLAAVIIGYTVSSAVLILAALVHGGSDTRFDIRGALWFAAVGLCNGLAVLATYAALGSGPVRIVSPLVASYPLVTVLLSHALLKEERLSPQLVIAVAATVGGVVLLIVT
jgi:drug/metabolite transporter (DMT)-like permease